MPIRPAQIGDIPALNVLLQEILEVHHQQRPDIFQARGQKYSEEELVALIKNPLTPVFVYEEEGQVLGHLFCQIQEARSQVLQATKTLFIDDLCVTARARGRKIGEKLYHHALVFAKQEGCHNLTLDVWNTNAGALQFYQGLGLKAQKTRLEERLTENKLLD